MTSVRRLLLDHCALALGLAMMVFAVRLLVPGGFMPGMIDGRAVLQICDGFGPVAAAPMAAMHHGAPAHHDDTPHKADMPCPYAALAQAATTPVDTILLAAALAFVLALGFCAVRRPPVRDAAYLRPMLRGPPTPA